MVSVKMRGEIRLWHWLVAIAVAAVLQIALLGVLFSSEPAQAKLEQQGMVLQLTLMDLSGSAAVAPSAPAAQEAKQSTALSKPIKKSESARGPGTVQPAKPKPEARPRPEPEAKVVLKKPLQPSLSSITLPVQVPAEPELNSSGETSFATDTPTAHVSEEGEKADAQSLRPALESAAVIGPSGPSGPIGPVGPVGPLAAALPGTESAQMKRLYERQLLTWIAEHKTYPPLARRRGLEGVAEVTFKLDANGRVESSSLSNSSGHAILDLAVMQLLERASPMPTPPAAISPNRLRFRVPIAFTLR